MEMPLRLLAWAYGLRRAELVIMPNLLFRRSIMRRTLICVCLMAPLALGAAELAGTWKYTAPPNPNAKGSRPPAETVYVIKVDGKRFAGTMIVNQGMSDILNGAIDGSQ